jgi:hypothetical protein
MYGGQLSMNYHSSFLQLALLCRERGIDFGWSNVINESLISRARNTLADSYLKDSSRTHAVFIDADIGFDALDILAMLEMDVDIVGVPCSKKSIRWDRVQHAITKRVFQWVKENEAICQNGSDVNSLAQQFQRDGMEIDPAEFPRIAGDFVMRFLPFEEKVIQVDKPEIMKQMGTGLLMIKREVFLKFKKAYPDRWYEAPHGESGTLPGQIHDFFRVGVNPETRLYDSEDFWFCKNCSDLGYKIWMLPHVRTTHMGTYTFVGDMPAALAYAGEI